MKRSHSGPYDLGLRFPADSWMTELSLPKAPFSGTKIDSYA